MAHRDRCSTDGLIEPYPGSQHGLLNRCQPTKLKGTDDEVPDHVHRGRVSSWSSHIPALDSGAPSVGPAGWTHCVRAPPWGSSSARACKWALSPSIRPQPCGGRCVGGPENQENPRQGQMYKVSVFTLSGGVHARFSMSAPSSSLGSISQTFHIFYKNVLCTKGSHNTYNVIVKK